MFSACKSICLNIQQYQNRMPYIYTYARYSDQPYNIRTMALVNFTFSKHIFFFLLKIEPDKKWK